MTAVQDPSKRKLFNRIVQAATVAPAVTTLQRVPAIAEQTQGVLWAGLAMGEQQALVAGDDGIIYHFDGKHWQQETLGTDLPIHAMTQAANGRVYAVGWAGIICYRDIPTAKSEINAESSATKVAGQWHYMQGGRKANTEESLHHQQQALPLFDIDSSPTGEVWAVGDQGRVICLCDDQWQEIDIGTTTNLRSVLICEDGSILIAGANGEVWRRSGDIHSPSAGQLDNQTSSWEAVESHSDCHIVSMAQTPNGEIYAVGGRYDGSSASFKGCIFHVVENQWLSIAEDIDLPRLRRVRCDGNNLVLVGDQGCAFYWSPENVRRIDTSLRYDFHDVICLTDHPMIICGDGGSVLLEQSLTAADLAAMQQVKTLSKWQPVCEGKIKQTLRGSHVFDDGSVIAVGDGGYCVHISSSDVDIKQVPLAVNLHDVWGTSPHNAFAVGGEGCIFHFNGEQWQPVHQGNAPTLLSITGFGPHDIYAVGDEGIILRYDGLMWRRVESGTKSELYHIWGHNPDRILIASAGGSVLRWNGDNWQSFYVGVDQDLYGVWGCSVNDLTVVGISGTLMTLRDQMWHKGFSGVRTDLHAVDGNRDVYPSDAVAFAVGSSGTVLRQQGDDWINEDTDVDVTLQTVSVGKEYAYAAGSEGVVLRRKLKL